MYPKNAFDGLNCPLMAGGVAAQAFSKVDEELPKASEKLATISSPLQPVAVFGTPGRLKIWRTVACGEVSLAMRSPTFAWLMFRLAFTLAIAMFSGTFNVGVMEPDVVGMSKGRPTAVKVSQPASPMWKA